MFNNKPQLRKKLESALSMITMAILLLSASTIIAANPILQSAYADDGLSFKKTKNLSNNGDESGEADIAVYGRNVYVVWYDEAGGNSDIFFKRSTDGGRHFDKIKNLSHDPEGSFEPKIAVYGNNVYVVWIEEVGPSNGEIYFRASNNDGKNFGSTKNLSRNPENSENPAIAAYGRNVYVVWEELVEDPFVSTEIFFKRSLNEGDSFGSTKNLSKDEGGSFNSDIAAYGRNVYVVWAGGTFDVDEIFFKRSLNEGDSFGSTKNLSKTTFGESHYPAIAAYGRNVYVVWDEHTSEEDLGGFLPAEIFFRKSTDRGDDFGKIKNLSRNPGESFTPDIAAFRHDVYVVWSDDTPPGEFSDIFLRKSTDRGDDFGKIKNLSKTDVSSDEPAIAAFKNKVYVVWRESPPEDIFFRRGSE